MKKNKNIIKHYVKESLDSLLIDQIVSVLFGVLVTWILGNNLQIIDTGEVPVYMKFLILAIAFLIVYAVSTIMQLRPKRYKFRMKSVDILVEYMGDTVKVYSTYVFSTNRFRANRMYARRVWFSDERFKFKSKTKGYKIKKSEIWAIRMSIILLFQNFNILGKQKVSSVNFGEAIKKDNLKTFIGTMWSALLKNSLLRYIFHNSIVLIKLN